MKRKSMHWAIACGECGFSWQLLTSRKAQGNRAYAAKERQHQRSCPRAMLTMTMREAVLLKRAAWDGPEPSAAEQRALDKILERIEAEQETRRR